MELSQSGNVVKDVLRQSRGHEFFLQPLVVSFPAVFLSVPPILCAIWFILDDVASIIATLISGTSYPISPTVAKRYY